MTEVEILEPSTLTPDEGIAWVMDAYGQAVTGIVETGRRLLELRNRMDGQWVQMFDPARERHLPFTIRTGQRFMAIAQHQALSDATHVSHLPASWGTLAELARLEPAEIQARIESGELTPTTERRQVQDWIRAKNNRPVGETPPLPDGTYRVIEADPPWSYAQRAPGAQWAPDNTYAVMDLDDICALPVADLADPAGSHLYLWATNSLLRDAFTVMDAWGFEYRQILTWVKPRIGLGSHWRNNTEQCLFGVRGSLPPLTKDKPTALVLDAPKQHSRKPDGFYRLVEQVSPGPYVRLFARLQRDGWTSWGAEA